MSQVADDDFAALQAEARMAMEALTTEQTATEVETEPIPTTDTGAQATTGGGGGGGGAGGPMSSDSKYPVPTLPATVSQSYRLPWPQGVNPPNAPGVKAPPNAPERVHPPNAPERVHPPNAPGVKAHPVAMPLPRGAFAGGAPATNQGRTLVTPKVVAAPAVGKGSPAVMEPPVVPASRVVPSPVASSTPVRLPVQATNKTHPHPILTAPIQAPEWNGVAQTAPAVNKPATGGALQTSVAANKPATGGALQTSLAANKAVAAKPGKPVEPLHTAPTHVNESTAKAQPVSSAAAHVVKSDLKLKADQPGPSTVHVVKTESKAAQHPPIVKTELKASHPPHPPQKGGEPPTKPHSTAPAAAAKTEWKAAEPPAKQEAETERPTLEGLEVPKVMSSLFLSRVVELFSMPALDLSWPNLIKKVSHVKESVLSGDVLRTLIVPQIQYCQETVARDKYHSSAAYLAFLLYLHDKLIDITFSEKERSITVHFSDKGELSIPSVRQFVLESGNDRFPWDVCQDNKVHEILSDPVTFIISATLDLNVSTAFPKLGKTGKIWKKMKGLPNVPIGLEAILDPDEKRVQKDFKTKKPILQVNADGQPLIYRTGTNTSIYVPYRSWLWISVKAGNMVEVQKLSIPNIGPSARSTAAGSNAGGKQPLKSVGRTMTSADTANGGGGKKSNGTHRSRRHSPSPSPSRSQSDDEVGGGSPRSTSRSPSGERRPPTKSSKDGGGKSRHSRSHKKNHSGGGGGGLLDKLRNMARR